MGDVDFLTVLFRWIHVGTAIVVLGGSVFMRFVLMPAGSKLPDDAHDELRKNVMAVWKRIVHGGIALFLISGFYNYLVVTRPLHDGDGRYHMLIGIKILLALVVFFLASALVGRSSAFEGLRQARAKWLAIVILLATVIVGISGFVKVRGVPATNSQPAAEANTE